MLLISEIRKKIKNKRREPWRTTSTAMEAPNHAHGHGGVSYMAVEVVYSRGHGWVPPPWRSSMDAMVLFFFRREKNLFAFFQIYIYVCVCARARVLLLFERHNGILMLFLSSI
jgi:hypothetical protein